MNSAYQGQKAAWDYCDFLDSENGQIQQSIIGRAITAALPKSTDTVLLDAGCGIGWLAAQLKNRYPKIYACDSSSPLIQTGKRRFPAVEFSHCDLGQPLPYPDGFFDAVILNMAGPDLENLPAALANMSDKIKTGGKLLMTVPNPSLTFPVAVWKRSLPDILLLRKPRLKINREYFGQKQISREFSGRRIPSYFYTLGDYLNAAKTAGLGLFGITELKSQTDSSRFDLNYQMFRYPLILLLEFRK